MTKGDLLDNAYDQLIQVVNMEDDKEYRVAVHRLADEILDIRALYRRHGKHLERA